MPHTLECVVTALCDVHTIRVLCNYANIIMLMKINGQNHRWWKLLLSEGYYEVIAIQYYILNYTVAENVLPLGKTVSGWVNDMYTLHVTNIFFVSCVWLQHDKLLLLARFYFGVKY